jgi:hypothetical protein
MTRHLAVESVTFGQVELAGPRSVRLSRLATPASAVSDHHRLPTSVELTSQSLVVEVVVRDIAAAETLPLGQQDPLTIVLPGDRQDGPSRQIQVDGAVLTAVELSYGQAAAAEATLRFVAQPEDGNIEPLSAEDLS